jgi:tetratricopeptide (TPR) repeat protein
VATDDHDVPVAPAAPTGTAAGEGQHDIAVSEPGWLHLSGRPERRSWLLRWFCLVAVVAASAYVGLEIIHHSPWYRQSLLRKLFSEDPQQQLRAATTLAHLKCQEELLLVLRSDVTSARELGRRALEHIWFHQAGKDAYRRLEQAHAAMEKKEYQRALALLDRMIDQYPTYAEAWNRRGALYFELGDFEKSLADSERALALNPNHYGAMQGIGVCRLQLGDVAEACRYLRAALKLLPHDDGTRRSLEKCEELLRMFPSPAKKPKSHDMV